ncbi:venom dipeptidyl peptidase 4 [Tribolium castaneum]|uniref:Venom dipeptidyl peptidase 4 n=1 Tax=Tribolium castaneum TaxID=7070 RepID=D6WJ57_TRICA|nr:PREDICTED: venom dipeptidyl peptidase 4 [Tribolium castaneum]EFA04427.1 Venom dipeptidyl peptidase 4-like Protein [Tribolium castaneum]|eukprot:XP_975053.1 PREDICTED: venom dipeptidyl peptidase 4 [Tribolium castaneum]
MVLCKVFSICLLLFVATEGKSVPKNDKEPFELNEFLLSTFGTKTFNGTWLTGDSIFHKNKDGDYILSNVKLGNASVFFNKSVVDHFPYLYSTLVSPDHRYVLIRYNVSAVFRHSTTSLYSIYDIENEKYYDIEDKNYTQYAQWAPIGHGLVYVYLNNLYYLKEPSGEPIALTTNGIPGIIYNGVPDWVYEEEVLGTGSALWFSPDGKQLAFAAFNDAEVKNFTYFTYGVPGVTSSQYPKEVTIKYPKVGTKNPDVKTYVVNLESSEEKVVPLRIRAIPESWHQNDDYVLYDMVWVTNDEFAVIYSNRVQNKAQLVRCNKDAKCNSVPEATYEEKNGWLEIHIPYYNKAGSQRIEILPQPEGTDEFDHLVLTDVATGNAKRLTKGPFYVTAVDGWDEANNNIYFSGTGENQPSQLHAYVVNIETLDVKCLTCEMNTSQGLCKYASALYSKDFSYVTKICRGPGPYLVEIHNLKDECDILIWEDNQALIDKLAKKSFPVIKNLKVPVPGGFNANVRMLLPPDLDENEPKKYPAVVNVYGGPNSNQISDAYTVGFQHYIVTNRKYIYIFIDARGSGKDGKNKIHQVYRKLATVEIEDQIAVTKYLQQKFPYIDANNTGIWGWSYGGFASAWVLVKDTENVFKFALSVAPVSSLIYYDSIYTERYMGLPTPEDNLKGYNNTDVTRKVLAMKGKLFFLIHGNADDNVHYQHSMLLSRALELNDVPFQQQSYPDENHSLLRVRPHLYHTIDRFWARSFDLPDPPAPRLVPPKM